MAMLKLKDEWDSRYKPVASDDEEGRVALHSPYTDGDDDGEPGSRLLNTEIPVRRPRRKRSKCCMCCGVDCGLFWKAFGIVVALFTLYGVFKVIRWAFTASPTGLEGMPAFSTSLGCLSASHIYNGSQVTVTALVGAQYDHTFDIRGGAVGTFKLAAGQADATDIKYELTIRASEQSTLGNVFFTYPDIDEDDRVTNSRFVIDTPRHDPADKSCMRYDITLYVPPTLKKLHILSHTVMHLQFAEDAQIDLDDFHVTLFTLDSSNSMILTSQHVQAREHLSLEVFRGWIVGDVSLSNNTAITTQRGDGIANVRVHPVAPSDPNNPEVAVLRTTTGAGRTDIFYIGNKAFKRPIESTHMSSRNAEVYLTYKEAEFNGKIELESKSYTLIGGQRLVGGPPAEEGQVHWTHFAGNKDGADKIRVSSRGWTGLYF